MQGDLISHNGSNEKSLATSKLVKEYHFLIYLYKSGNLEYRKDRLKWAEFATWKESHKILYNIATFTKLCQYYFTHTLQTLLGMLRDVSGRRWQTSQINSAE